MSGDQPKSIHLYFCQYCCPMWVGWNCTGGSSCFYLLLPGAQASTRCASRCQGFVEGRAAKWQKCLSPLFVLFSVTRLSKLRQYTYYLKFKLNKFQVLFIAFCLLRAQKLGQERNEWRCHVIPRKRLPFNSEDFAVWGTLSCPTLPYSRMSSFLGGSFELPRNTLL